MNSQSLLSFLSVTAIAVLLSTAPSNADTVTYSTSFDSPTFSAGNLDGQDGWVAQGQWQADGTGNITEVANNGAMDNAAAFVRAHNTGILGSTDVGEMMQIVSTFSLGDFTTPSNDIASFEQGIFQQGLSHQQGSQAFAYGLATGIFYNPTSGEVELRSNQGSVVSGTSNLSLGTASGLANTTFTLDTKYTKTGANEWAVDVSIDDGTGPLFINYVANGLGTDLDTDSDGGGIIGGIQGLPSGGGSPGVATPPFGSTTVTDFSISVITAVPEPSTLALFGLVGMLAGTRRRR